MKILKVLSRGNTHVNDLAQQTSSDKVYVLDVIKTLEREGLILEIKDDKHSQKKIKQLTELGDELAKIVKNVEDYKTSYSKLRKRRKECFTSFGIKKAHSEIEDGVRAHGKTWHKIGWGWRDTENELYLYGARGASLLEYESTIHITNILIFRFASMQKKFALRNVTKAIMNSIITDATTFQLELVLSDILDNDDGSRLMEGELPNHTGIITSLPLRLAEYPLFVNKSISDDAKNMLMSIFSLLQPSQNEIEVQVNTVKKLIAGKEKFIQEYLNDHGGHSRRTYMQIENLKSVLAFYERRDE